MYIRTSSHPATITIPYDRPPLAGGCACGCSGHAPGGLGLVTPPDHRQLVRDTRIVPHRWICALDLFFPWKGGEQRNAGTGFLISPRHILTAGHNIRPAAGVEALRITVTPGSDGASVLGKPKGPVGSVTLTRKDWWVAPQFANPTDHRWDVALLVLPTELPAFRGMTYGYWGDPRYEPATVFTPMQAAPVLGPIVHVSGYPADKCGDKTCAPCSAQVPAAYDPVRAKSNWASMQWASAGAILPDPPAGLILHNADTCTGMSGSPVWELRRKADGKQSMVLVAMHTGVYTRQNRITRVDETLNRGISLSDQAIRDMLRARMIRDKVRALF
jgi:V8-like Glu-specific endopeptidase